MAWASSLLVGVGAKMRRIFGREGRCRWYGTHSGEVAVGVEVGRPCGHVDKSTPTCRSHLVHLLSQGGRAHAAVPCPVCGIPGVAEVIGTCDLRGERDRSRWTRRNQHGLRRFASMTESLTERKAETGNG